MQETVTIKDAKPDTQNQTFPNNPPTNSQIREGYSGLVKRSSGSLSDLLGGLELSNLEVIKEIKMATNILHEVQYSDGKFPKEILLKAIEQRE